MSGEVAYSDVSFLVTLVILIDGMYEAMITLGCFLMAPEEAHYRAGHVYSLVNEALLSCCLQEF